MKNLHKYDQFFLEDFCVVEKLLETANLKKGDIVLEIGPGTGVVTRELAKQVGRVVAIEIDPGLAQALAKLPKNVEVIFGNALLLMDKIKYNKIVSSLPSSIIEPLFKILVHKKFDVMMALIPLKFVNKLQGEVLSVYFETELLEKVEPGAFHPQPKTNWALVRITPKADPLKQKDYSRFIRKYLIDHPKAKLKNALMEAVIIIEKSEGKDITKNQAREIVDKLNISRDQMEEIIDLKIDLSEIAEKILRVLT
ncbi:MAG: rRNA adenine N-6-methyltransferase family protein [Patescibacteria group bacterium]|jgi:16S rRNA (adenine1518-N6/adenine1519-N6)-dimethyltransferase